MILFWACSGGSATVKPAPQGASPSQLVQDETGQWVLEPELARIVEGDEGLGAAIQLGLDYVAQAYEAPPAEGVVDLDRHRAAMEARRRRILDEIEALGEHDWAGVYSSGGGYTGFTLCIAPKSGAVWRSWGCMGTYDLNHGDIVEYTGDRFTFDLAFDAALNTTRRYTFTMPRRMVSDEWFLVRWGDERIVVPSTKMVEACASAGGGFFSGYRRRDHEPNNMIFSNIPEVPPQIPEPYGRFVLDENLTCSIVRAEPCVQIGTFTTGQDKYRVRAEVDIGAKQGLLPGMRVHITEPGKRGKAEVVWVGASRGLVEFRGAALDDDSIAPKVGWSLKTY